MTRFMTTNAWADVFGNPVPGRDLALIRLVKNYRPDVIFLQEFHPNWHRSALKPALDAMGYAEAQPDLNGNEYNYTPLFYNAAHKLIKTGFWLFSGLNDYTSKSFTYALLEKPDGKQYLAVATHLYFEDNERGNEARVGNVGEIMAAVNELDPTGKLPVFIGGDLNCDIHSDPYRAFEQAGLTDAAKLAERVINPVDSFHKPPVFKDNVLIAPAPLPGGDFAHSIDHVIVRPEIKITDVTLDISEDARLYSDHCPVIVDAEL